MGQGRLANSTLLSLVNQGNYLGAAGQFLLWNNITNPTTGVKKPDDGLTIAAL